MWIQKSNQCNPIQIIYAKEWRGSIAHRISNTLAVRRLCCIYGEDVTNGKCKKLHSPLDFCSADSARSSSPIQPRASAAERIAESTKRLGQASG